MSIELQKLYDDIKYKYEVKVLTKSLFDREISWLHILDNQEFAHYLHGNELIFNSSLNYHPEEIIPLIQKLIKQNAGGLVVALRNETQISEEALDLCNNNQMPIIYTPWDTPYVDVIRQCSEAILTDERNSANLHTAVQNAIYYPENRELYLKNFAQMELYNGRSYTITLIQKSGPPQIERTIRFHIKKAIIIEETNRLVLFTWSKRADELQTICGEMLHTIPAKERAGVTIGIGSTTGQLEELHQSYQQAEKALQVAQSSTLTSVQTYDSMGIYRLLLDTGEQERESYVRDILGPIKQHDQEKGSDYLEILQAFMGNECSYVHTATQLYCHKNTLYYKIDKIKEIMGCDILLNENRMKIQLALKLDGIQ